MGTAHMTMTLVTLMDRFLAERLETGRLSIRRVADHRFDLVGSPVPFIHVG